MAKLQQLQPFFNRPISFLCGVSNCCKRLKKNPKQTKNRKRPVTRSYCEPLSIYKGLALRSGSFIGKRRRIWKQWLALQRLACRVCHSDGFAATGWQFQILRDGRKIGVGYSLYLRGTLARVRGRGGGVQFNVAQQLIGPLE